MEFLPYNDPRIKIFTLFAQSVYFRQKVVIVVDKGTAQIVHRFNYTIEDKVTDYDAYQDWVNTYFE